MAPCEAPGWQSGAWRAVILGTQVVMTRFPEQAGTP